MEISFDRLRGLPDGALVVGILDGGNLTDSASTVDKATGGAISRALAASRFRGQPGHSLELLVPAGIKSTPVKARTSMPRPLNGSPQRLWGAWWLAAKRH